MELYKTQQEPETNLPSVAECLKSKSPGHQRRRLASLRSDIASTPYHRDNPSPDHLQKGDIES